MRRSDIRDEDLAGRPAVVSDPHRMVLLWRVLCAVSRAAALVLAEVGAGGALRGVDTVHSESQKGVRSGQNVVHMVNAPKAKKVSI